MEIEEIIQHDSNVPAVLKMLKSGTIDEDILRSMVPQPERLDETLRNLQEAGYIVPMTMTIAEDEMED